MLLHRRSDLLVCEGNAMTSKLLANYLTDHVADSVVCAALAER